MNNDFKKNDEIITLKMLRNYALETIENENLIDTCIDVKDDETCDDVMVFNFRDKIIKINYNSCLSDIKRLYMDLDYCCDSYVSKLNHANKWDSLEFKTRITNLFLMCYINHELQHVRQFNEMKNTPSENNNQLIMVSYALYGLDLKFTNRDYYKNYYNKFLFEYQANTMAGYKTIEQFTTENKKGIEDEELQLLNMFVAAGILDGYTGMGNNLADKSYPIQFLKDLSKVFNNYRQPLIEVLLSRETPNDSIEDLLLGRKLSDDILNKMYDVALGKQKTLNFYDDLYKKGNKTK